MLYQKRTAALLFSTATLMIFCSVSCQSSQNSSGSSPLPVSSASATLPSPTPTPAGTMSDVKLCPACHGEYKVLPNSQICPPVPNCPATDPRVRPMPPLIIEESKYAALKTQFNLADIQMPSESLGGLQPAPVLAEATISNCEAGKGILPLGGLSRGCRVLLLEKDGQTTLLDTPAKFKQAFAPVDSAEEALSFATTLTGAFPLYEFDKRSPGRSAQGSINLMPEFRYFSSSFVPTTVNKAGNDYLVMAFKYQQFGCGPHPYYAVTYRVTPAGEVSEVSSTKLVEDPNFDGLCAD
ncbi:MAG: hypothetical protein AB7I41_07175 [Candidatus Sericytochromatia bacterium]